MKRNFIGLLIVLLVVAPLAFGQEKCGAAKDYVVQAREKARPGMDHSQLQEQYQQLRRAIEFCPSMGDAYYYRSLFARQLGNLKDANYMLGKARENDSEALNYGMDPFTISQEKQEMVDVSPVVREKWALVVGVSKYRNSIPALQFPAKDARDFAAVLKDPQYGRFKQENVRILTDEDATTQRIKEGLNWLARNAQKDDLVVVFVSSHGSPREMDTSGVSYIITYNTDASSQDTLYSTALEMVEIVDALSTRVKAQRGVLFLDTCYSGAVASNAHLIRTQNTPFSNPTNRETVSGAGSKALVAEGVGVASGTLERISYHLGRVVITASQPDERSWESESIKNGYFTYNLIQGLKQNSGKLPLGRLYDYLRYQVPRQVIAEKKIAQTPMMFPIRPNVEIIIGIETQPL